MRGEEDVEEEVDLLGAVVGGEEEFFADEVWEGDFYTGDVAAFFRGLALEVEAGKFPVYCCGVVGVGVGRGRGRTGLSEAGGVFDACGFGLGFAAEELNV